MAKANTIDGRACGKLLKEAAHRNATLDLIRLLDSGPDACRSRFVELPNAALAVEVPSRLGRPVPVRPDEKVEIYFRIKDCRYYFRTKVESRSKIAITERFDLPVLVIAPPKSIECRQRRQFVRVAMPEADRLMAHLWLVDDPHHQDETSQLPPTEVLDVSGGGMRVLLEGRKRGLVKEGQQVHLHVDLTDGRAPLKLVAHVEHVDRTLPQAARFGLHFEGLDETPEARAIRDRLLKFVAWREREELKRMKKLRER